MSMHMLSNMAAVESKFLARDLIAALQKYKALHTEEYQKAVEVYRDDVVVKVKELIKRLKPLEFTTFEVTYNLGLTIPVNVEKEYDKLIELFSRLTEDEIELNFAEANHVLNNDWDFATSASVSNSYYAVRHVKKGP